jgi:hypothetical protein
MSKHVGHRIHEGLATLNDSKFFVGLIMIAMNIGSKYITVKLSNTQESYLRNHVAREVVVFCGCWIGTRDLYVSIILTASFFILSEHMFNELSPLCVLPHRFRGKMGGDAEITRSQLKDAVETIKRASRQVMN